MQQAEVQGTEHHLQPPTTFIGKYIFSTDHKMIGKQYLMLSVVSVFVGLFLSLLIRTHLSTWQSSWQLMHPDTYLQMLTMHGTILVFMVLTAAPLGGFGNFVLPLQIGAEDMAFPRLNMLSFWLTFLSFVTLMACFFVPGNAGGPPISGWTGYPPLSAINDAGTPGMGWGQSLWVLSIAFFCLAALVGSINFIVTTLDLRCRGLKLMHMPLSVWGWFAAAVVSLLTFAVLFAAGLLLLLDRHLGTSFFIPEGIVWNNEMLNHKGGSPLLFQHLFWFFGHPEVYIIILPAAGIVSHILTTFARKPAFGYRTSVAAMGVISTLGMLVWGHHMFQSGMSPYTAVFFSILTILISVPSGVLCFNWLGTLWGGRLRFNTAMYFALGFVSLFVSGGITGFFLAQTVTDIYLHDTYFVVAHFHIIMGVAAMFAIAAGMYFWFPKMFGRHLNETLGRIHFWTSIVGAYAIFIPMHVVGLWGHPRRYAGFEFELFANPMIPAMHDFMTWASYLASLGQLVFLFNIVWSYYRGRKAESNPWACTSLEWTVNSPPPFDNFAGRHPTVHHGPYEYGVPGAAKEFIMQDDPPEARAKATAQSAHA